MIKYNFPCFTLVVLPDMESASAYLVERSYFYQYFKEICKPFHSAINVSWGPRDDAISCFTVITSSLQNKCHVYICATLTFENTNSNKSLH